jgi:hypothetical protein
MRREVKFVARASELDRLLAWLRLHRAGFRRAFPPRWVNNLYFDSYDYSAFSENLVGGSERAKVRYRWYGDSLTPDSGALEVKVKRNVFGWKLRYAISRSPYRPGVTLNAVVRALRDGLPTEGRLWLEANPMPVLINRYLRRYLVSSDESVRVTVDTDQSVRDQRLRSQPNVSRHSRPADTLVVEFKFAPHQFDVASAWLQGIPIRVSRHSKYIQGVVAIAGRY